MATFVLVHGSFGGGWVWDAVAPLLRAAGHAVHAVTLTGGGERVHLAHPEIDLDTHIRDVVNALEYERLDGVILVGWSYGGMVITGVADRVPERITRLVYIDAATPEDGQCIFDIAGPDAQAMMEEQARREGDGWRIPPVHEMWRPMFGDDMVWERFSSRLTPQPIKTFSQRIRLTNDRRSAIPTTLILTIDGLSAEEIALERVQADGRGWDYRELAINHFAPVIRPRETADLLLEIAAMTATETASEVTEQSSRLVSR